MEDGTKMSAFLSDEWVAEAKQIQSETMDLGEPAVKVRMNLDVVDVPSTISDDVVTAHLDTSDGALDLDLGHMDIDIDLGNVDRQLAMSERGLVQLDLGRQTLYFGERRARRLQSCHERRRLVISGLAALNGLGVFQHDDLLIVWHFLQLSRQQQGPSLVRRIFAPRAAGAKAAVGREPR